MVLFTSEGRSEHEIDRWIGAVSAVMRKNTESNRCGHQEGAQSRTAASFSLKRAS